jgi:hypothetical protein
MVGTKKKMGCNSAKRQKRTLRKRRSKPKKSKRVKSQYSLLGGFIRSGSVQQFVKTLLN